MTKLARMDWSEIDDPAVMVSNDASSLVLKGLLQLLLAFQKAQNSNNIEWLRVKNVSFSSLVPFVLILQALITA